ncbi:hypothetical protein AS156_30055 [Bradyrhizobium macuxiense]|uniref:Uncharacterized protein n=1 Tax=Bradyrhizobium macuxiense TaxID=1755647 RepID=A0A125QAD0_9BRAD|nr:hypothetical protein [Bradyrhizobium macuxiense]KWV60185.1 hypothetical protein AS156_30055 [Bradyrhizobium macuxiense]
MATTIDPGTLILIADAIKSAVESALEANSIEAAKAPLETVKAFNEQLLKLAVAAQHEIDRGNAADTSSD